MALYPLWPWRFECGRSFVPATFAFADALLQILHVGIEPLLRDEHLVEEHMTTNLQIFSASL